VKKPIKASNQHSEVDNRAQRNCLPQWVTKTIEAVGLNIGDIMVGWHTRSQKHYGSVSLMTRVLETSDPKTFEEVKG